MSATRKQRRRRLLFLYCDAPRAIYAKMRTLTTAAVYMNKDWLRCLYASRCLRSISACMLATSAGEVDRKRACIDSPDDSVCFARKLERPRRAARGEGAARRRKGSVDARAGDDAQEWARRQSGIRARGECWQAGMEEASMFGRILVIDDAPQRDEYATAAVAIIDIVDG